MFTRSFHQAIYAALECFDAKFLHSSGVGFGGGTRIAMELGEYRESVDIDFICPSAKSYSAVRDTVDSSSLGRLLVKEIPLAREVLADRYGVRTVLISDSIKIKLEFLAFEGWNLALTNISTLPIPVIDIDACFATKFTAMVDRGLAPPYKDIIDVIALCMARGEPTKAAVSEAERHYGLSVMTKVEFALKNFLQLSPAQKQETFQSLSVSADFQQRINGFIARDNESILPQLASYGLRYK